MTHDSRYVRSYYSVMLHDVHVLHATENKNVVKLDNIFFKYLLDKCNTRKDKVIH